MPHNQVKSRPCDVDDDIRIIYGPILEKIKNHMSLEEVLRGDTSFGVLPH